MFSVEQIKNAEKRQEIVTNPWTNCKTLSDSETYFGMYNKDKELAGFAAVQKNNLVASITCFELEPFSNQAVLRDFFFKGVLGILSRQGMFFLQVEASCSALMKEFDFEENTIIEDLLKGSCSHDSSI